MLMEKGPSDYDLAWSAALREVVEKLAASQASFVLSSVPGLVGPCEGMRFPKMLNMSHGLFGRHWATTASRGIRVGLFTSILSGYSRVLLRTVRMQRKFARHPERYVSAASYALALAAYEATSFYKSRHYTDLAMLPVRPMAPPVASIYYMDYKYSDRAEPVGGNAVEVQPLPPGLGVGDEND